jgi:hypothetical protein
MSTARLREIDFQKVVDDPKSFGAPTFEEFAKNPNKWLPRDEEVFDSIDNGPTDSSLRQYIDKFVYEIEGYQCHSIEEAYRVAKEQGIPLKSLDYRVQILPETSYKGKFLVKIAPKQEFEKRRKW